MVNLSVINLSNVNLSTVSLYIDEFDKKPTIVSELWVDAELWVDDKLFT